MHIEFILLGGVIILALVNILWAANVRTKEYGIEWNMGARDESMPPLSPLGGRLLRAQANLFETLPLFIGALLGAAAAGHLGWKTAIGANLYFWGRVVYLPLYAKGVPKFRSAAWAAALLGLVIIIWALIFN